ncbi:protein refolding chaperone Spy/CpxP family [Methylobacillus rhizosphaerae]|uniref:Protein refolding chaperone Spy/CpxP family n=1 Tax=Methylobacillus rhizosphaerae TaxID=551994 RepID=A0A239AFT4_9PROT|nr:Spy/CpxP family protein refolding chaperone [Methylobacillus rhizosphaerae]SNR93868.1 protein refolding chaperone Spy/CpxP family [Methylobacillus rhizosphaerae]
MATSRKLWISTALLASSLFAVNAAVSHAGSGDHKDGKCDKDKKHASFNGHKRFADGSFLHHKLRPLNLSEEQQAQVKQIMEKQKPLFAEKRQAAHDGFKALAVASSKDAYDEKSVQQLAEGQAKAQADLLVLRTNTMHQVYQILTPEQKQKWAEFQSRVKPAKSREREKV